MAGPTTAFESSTDDNPAWTRLSEEQSFVQDIASQSDRVSLSTIGNSAVDANPINLVAIGYPSAPTDDELRGKSVVLVLGLQHGNEPSGRETALHKLRDLAFSEDAAVQDYLSRHPVLFVPTVNPDSFDSDRHNGLGNDINRQWLSYADAEVQAVSTVIRDYAPHILVDLHEKPGGSTQFEFLHPTNSEVASGIASTSETIHSEGRSALSSAGFSTGLYNGGTGVNILRNNGGTQNIITVLAEASGQNNTTYLTRKQAVEGFGLFLNIVFDYHRDNVDAIKATVAQAMVDSRQIGEDQGSISSPSITPPVGYSLTEAQYSTVSTSLDRLRLNAFPLASGTDYFVPMAQGTKRALPFLVDGAAPDNVISATALQSEPELAPPTERYNVRWRRAGSTGLAGAELGIQATELAVLDLEPDTGYEWQAQSQYASESSAWASWSQFTTQAFPPVTIGTPTVGKTTANIPFTYDGTAANGFEYRLNGGAWTDVSSPISLTGLTPSTAYSVEVRAYNVDSESPIESVAFITQEAVDTAPDAFAPQTRTNVARSSLVEFDPVIISGVDAGVDVPVTITNGEYSVSTDGGATYGGYTSATTNVRLNYRIRVRHTAGADYTSGDHDGTTVTELDAGGTTATFTSATIADTEAPVISLVDGNLSWTQGKPWAEPGYSATDNADGDVTASVVVTGSVDTATLGQYTLTYKSTDSSGNTSQTTRTVTVVEDTPSDTTAPAVTIDGAATTDNTPTITGTCSDPTATLLLYVNGVAYAPKISGGNWSQTLNTQPIGTRPMTITATDPAGNASVATASLTVNPVPGYAPLYTTSIRMAIQTLYINTDVDLEFQVADGFELSDVSDITIMLKNLNNEVSKTLNNGIQVDNNSFILSVERGDVTTAGEYDIHAAFTDQYGKHRGITLTPAKVKFEKFLL